MLLVTLFQLVALAFCLTSLLLNELMISPEKKGVTCSISILHYKYDLKADNLRIFWGWQSLIIRWKIDGNEDSQMRISETYHQAYYAQCQSTEFPSINVSFPEPTHHTFYYQPNSTSNISNSTVYTSTSIGMEGNGCQDLKVIINTGKIYFGLLLSGIVFGIISLCILFVQTCYLVTIYKRRCLKQLIIILNIMSFVLLLLAFAVWIAYFSQNINDVIEEGEHNNNFYVCLLGDPEIGISVILLICGWMLIGISTIGSCYCGNVPRCWYIYLQKTRIGFLSSNALNVDQNIDDGNMENVDGNVRFYRTLKYENDDECGDDYDECVDISSAMTDDCQTNSTTFSSGGGTTVVSVSSKNNGRAIYQMPTAYFEPNGR